jgi:hypothetical protein
MQRMLLGMGIERSLSTEERAAYLAPYADREKRRVVRDGPGPATFPWRGRSQDPADLAAAMDRNAAGLRKLDVPILLLHAEPGFIVQPPAIAYARANFRRLEVVNVGAGKHFLPEDQPTAVGRAIADWHQREVLPRSVPTLTPEAHMTTPTHVRQLVADPAAYEMDIQAAGLATIPTASLAADGSLTLSYRYESEGEKRRGSMTLASRGENQYAGHWKTDAHTGNVYQGTLHFTFAADGTATGSYRFDGRDYAITIRKRR